MVFFDNSIVCKIIRSNVSYNVYLMECFILIKSINIMVDIICNILYEIFFLVIW